LPAPISYKQNIIRIFNEIEASAQHFQVFVGFKKSSEELQLPSYNYWMLGLPSSAIEKNNYDYDAFLTQFYKDPLHAPMMGFMSFPSAKDPLYKEHYGDNKATCVIITEIPTYHFEKWAHEESGNRGADYEQLKKQIGDRLIEECLFKHFPQCRENISKVEYGTPLSSQHYLGCYSGESYGLMHSIKRYFDFDIGRALVPKTPIPGLYLTGQDLVSAGWSGAFRAGILTAESILGYHEMIHLFAGRSLINDLIKINSSQN